MQFLKKSKLALLSSVKPWTLRWIPTLPHQWTKTQWILTRRPATARSLSSTSLAFQLTIEEFADLYCNLRGHLYISLVLVSFCQPRAGFYDATKVALTLLDAF